MNNKILTISVFVIIGAVVFLGIGYLVGVSSEQQKSGPQLQKFEEAEKIVKAISSKVVTSVVGYGDVTKISDRTITLTYGKESLDIRVKEDVSIYSFEAPIAPEKGIVSVPAQKKAEFSDIKVGSKINATIKILPDSRVEATSIIIIPQYK